MLFLQNNRTLCAMHVERGYVLFAFVSGLALPFTERHSARSALRAVSGGRHELRGLRFPVGCALLPDLHDVISLRHAQPTGCGHCHKAHLLIKFHIQIHDDVLLQDNVAPSRSHPAYAPPAGATHGIGVIIDVHATNGSQNGYDHSAPVVVNGVGQQMWDSAAQPTPSYPAQAITLVSTLAARYGASEALLGISLLNEPTVGPDCTLAHLGAHKHAVLLRSTVA